MSLLLHKKQPFFLERDSGVLGDFVAYSFQYCARFSVIFRIEVDDASIYVKENLDVGNVYISLDYLLIFAVISFMIYLIFNLSLYYLGSFGSLRVCHGTLIFEQSKFTHLNLNFL